MLSGPDKESSKTAELLSLYIDPQVRRRGIGAGLLYEALTAAAAAGAAELEAYYTAEPEDVEALDSLFHSFGAEPAFHSPIYVFDSSGFHEAPLLRKAFTGQYRRTPQIVPFSALSDTQLAELEKDPDLLRIVDPVNRPNWQPELSLAYLLDGRVVGFWLGAMTGPNRYSVQGAWRNSQAPLICIHAMLLAHVNLCFYHGGGDFLYYISPAVERADRLIQRYSGGNYRRLEEHVVRVPLSDERDA